MTNFEKYKNKIMEIITESNSIPAKQDGKIIPCEGLRCGECDFSEGSCKMNQYTWLCEDDGKEHDGCDGCKYEHKREDESPCTECSSNYTSRWERRPKRTRQDEFLEHYPNAKTNTFTGALIFCPVSIDENANVNCSDCNKCKRDYWLQEVEE